MARSSSSWREGCSGNPAGRNHYIAIRTIYLRLLNRPYQPGAETTVLEHWLSILISETRTPEAIYNALKFPRTEPGGRDERGRGSFRYQVHSRRLIDNIKSTVDDVQEAVNENEDDGLDLHRN